MNKIVYSPVETKMETEVLGNYLAYGISVKKSGENGESVLRIIEDVSLEYEYVEKLADLMNEGMLEAEHIDDVLADFVV